MELRKARYWTSLAAACLAIVGLAAASADNASARVTAADLTGKLAQAARDRNDQSLTQALVGLKVGSRPDAPLTEKEAVTILQSLGFAATTRTPDRLLTNEKAAALVRNVVLSSEARSAAIGALTGKDGLPASVEDCFVEKNHGACVMCCKDLGGGASSCAKACFIINKPSAEEPLP